MIRIGRDHGVPKHIVGRWPMEELAEYAANYIYDAELEEKARAKAHNNMKIK